MGSAEGVGDARAGGNVDEDCMGTCGLADGADDLPRAAKMSFPPEAGALAAGAETGGGEGAAP